MNKICILGKMLKILKTAIKNDATKHIQYSIFSRSVLRIPNSQNVDKSSANFKSAYVSSENYIPQRPLLTVIGLLYLVFVRLATNRNQNANQLSLMINFCSLYCAPPRYQGQSNNGPWRPIWSLSMCDLIELNEATGAQYSYLLGGWGWEVGEGVWVASCCFIAPWGSIN